MLAVSISPFVKVFGCRPLANDATDSSGRRRKTSKGGKRAVGSGTVRRTLWGFERGRQGVGVVARGSSVLIGVVAVDEAIGAVERSWVD
jgi:hypothetical protein